MNYFQTHVEIYSICYTSKYVKQNSYKAVMQSFKRIEIIKRSTRYIYIALDKNKPLL